MLQEFKKQAHLEVGAGWRQKVGVREELAFTLVTITSSRAVTLACPFGGGGQGVGSAEMTCPGFPRALSKGVSGQTQE